MRRAKKRPARTGRFHQHHQSTPRARRDRHHTTEVALAETLYGGGRDDDRR